VRRDPLTDGRAVLPNVTAIKVSSVRLGAGLTVSYASVGDPSGSPVVFLPGPTDSWVSYTPILEHLPSSVRAIAVSQRGHGDSDKPSDGYRVADFAADLLAFLDALHIRRAVVTGHSGSCLTARRFAIDHPDRVAGLVLEASPSTLRGNAELTAFVEGVVAGLEDPIDPAFARSFVADTSSDRLDPEMVDRLGRELVKVPAGAWRQMFTDLLAYDDLDEIDCITAPTLLVWGDADALVNREMQTTLAARLGKAELIVYENVGHTPRWEEPARFARDVVEFTHRWVQPPH
jgi:pimeloyl-ACP methyl ester carboxylesterase